MFRCFEEFIDPERLFFGTIALQQAQSSNSYWRVRVAVWSLDEIPNREWLPLVSEVATVTCLRTSPDDARVAWPVLEKSICRQLFGDRSWRMDTEDAKRLLDVLKLHFQILSQEKAEPFIVFEQEAFCSSCGGFGCSVCGGTGLKQS